MGDSTTIIDVYFRRQIYVVFTGCLFGLSSGTMVAFPSMLSPSLLDPNSTDIKTTPDQAHWLTTTNGLSGIIGFLIIPPIMQSFGRKIVTIVINSLLLIGWLTIAFANSIEILFLARFTQGLVFGSALVGAMIVSEYASPKRRGYFIALKKMSQSVGHLICHLTGIVMNWRQISVLAGSINLLCIILVFFWVESPSHLAMKGRFDECEKSFLWLYGNSLETKKELSMLISTQMKRLNETTERTGAKIFFKQFFKRDFVKPFFICMLLCVMKEASGRHYFATYSVEMLSQILRNRSDALYFTLGIDCLTIFTLSMSCFVVRKLKRRVLLFTFGTMCSFVLFITSLTLFFNCSIWLTSILVLVFCFCSNLGVVPVIFSICGEIFPLDKKGFGTLVTGIMMSLLYSGMLRVVPILLKEIRVEGTFTVFGVCLLSCLSIFYFILPETKDKTLVEIENEIKGIKSSLVETTPMMTL